ncbi:ATP-binding protein [Clostridium swellfunianum]|uniref:ATP-binding protein n=1 Tax=Clostridium swellfunianum TaxID=1367462 RepID=UPI00202F2BA5|nr:ATP-binding protein [Clostridium swellfunianum]MCM0647639.1 ATP-binding protein [Clostridium swellfunianum]
MKLIKSARIRLIILFIIMSTAIFTLIFFSTKIGSTNKTMPTAYEGVIDLRNWDFEKDGMVKLNGQWEFYKNQLLTPSDFNDAVLRDKNIISIPGIYASQGYGTLRLKLLLNPSENVNSIKIEFLQSACKLWVNNRELISNGEVGANMKEMKPRVMPKYGSFSAKGEEVNLTLQVSNFYSKLGSIDTIVVGDSSQVESKSRKQLAFDLLIFGSTMMAALYNLGLFIKRKKNKATLYFAIICLVVALRTLFLGERFIFYLFPNFSYVLSGKIMHWTFYLYIPFIVLFLNSFYNNILSTWLVKATVLSAYVYALIILVSPNKYYMDIILPFEVFTVLILIYLINKISRLYIKKNSSDYLMVIGLFALFATRLNDILYEYSIIITGSFAPFGTLIFIIVNSYLLAERQSMAFNNAENMTEKLESINKLKDEFLAVTSHELKTPLNGIIGLSELLNISTSNLSKDEIQSLALINTSAKRLSNLVNDITMLSKLKNGDIKLQRNPVDIGKLVESIVKFCGLTLDNKNLNIINLVDTKAPCVLGDEERIMQILFNLLGNAIKFTYQGSIKISYTVKTDFLEVSIEDSGIGIPKNKLENIFDIYEQVEGISDKYGGTGLGLYITRKIVELHGGIIWVESVPGKGSVFSFTLPLCKFKDRDNNISIQKQNISSYDEEDMFNDTSARFNIDGSRIETSENRRHKVLIVDDEYVNRRVLESYLTTENLVTINASTGKEALMLLERHEDIDLVILDMMIPDLLGCEISSIIRQKKSLFELPILIMTANNNTENLVLAFEYGANDYLAKPFNQQELLARVNTLIALKNSVQEAISLTKQVTTAENKLHELEEYDKLRTELFANLSHELRTPLNVICSTIQLLESLDASTKFGEEKIKYYLSIMKQNSIRLLRLINNIIDMTKVEGNHLALNLSNNNIVYFVEEICQSVAEFIKSQDIEIIFDTEIEEKVIAIDEEKFERIILNILSNAVKFTDKGGSIFVNIYDKEEVVEISIKDTGVGIPEDKLEFIFERFAQLDKSLSRSHEGSGIGLSLVKSLVEMHGGRIFAESRLGEGTNFIIQLPSKLVQENDSENNLTKEKESRYEKNLHMEFSDIYM